MSTAHQLTNSDVEAPKKASEPTSGGNILNDNGFIPSVGSNTIVALLMVMETLMKVANTYGRMLVDQLKTQSQITTTVADLTEAAANDEANSVRIQGIMGMAAGGASVGLSLYSFTSKPKGVSELDGQIEGATNYRNYMDSEPTSVSTVAGSGTDKVAKSSPDITEEAFTEKFRTLKNKSNEEFAKTRENIPPEDKETMDLVKKNSTKKEELIEAYDKKIENLNNAKNARTQKHSAYLQNVATGTQGVNNVVTSTGSVISAGYKVDQGKDDAQKTEAQGALQTAQGMTSQTRGHTDEYLQQAQGTTQLIGAISNANKLAG